MVQLCYKLSLYMTLVCAGDFGLSGRLSVLNHRVALHSMTRFRKVFVLIRPLLVVLMALQFLLLVLFHCTLQPCVHIAICHFAYLNRLQEREEKHRES